MDLSIFRQLTSPAGQEILQAAAELQPTEADFLRHFTALRRRFPAELARAGLETAILRQQAREKLPQADRMYFTRPALEQATHYMVSSYRAQRYRPFELLFDLGCSIGADTLYLAAVAPTIGVDLDALRLAMARANQRALNLSDRTFFVQADLNAPLPFLMNPKFSQSTALFFDPARRQGERRLFSIHDYQPPLGVVQSWLADYPALGVKISPGVDLGELSGFDAEIEFISLQGELKEAVLWFGPLKTAARRATVLPGPYTLTGLVERALSPTVSSALPQSSPLSEPQAYLYEPDPAILRAGLVQKLASQLEACQLDPDIAYLTSDQLVKSPFARAWRVETWLPFGIKQLRAALRQRGVGHVVVKKRGSPLKPEEILRSLRLRDAKEPRQAERVLFLTHLRGRPIVILCFTEQLSP